VYAQKDELQAWEDLIGCMGRVRARKTPNASREPLADGLQYMEPGGIPAFTLSSTFYLQISTF
jgi:hypothetical protein